MLSFLRNLFLPIRSSFVVNEVDHLRKVVVVEDKQLGLKVEIPFGDKALKKVKIIEPYAVLLTYQDGTKVQKPILK